MRSLRSDFGTELIELTNQPEEKRIRLADGGVGEVLLGTDGVDGKGSSRPVLFWTLLPLGAAAGGG